MSTLELECPGCDQLLELDAGFAGGVCRCSNCGTLMTVPARAGQAVEAVKRRRARPERPGEPATTDRPARPATPHEAPPAAVAPASTAEPDERDQPVEPAEPSARAEAPEPVERPEPVEADEGGESGEQVYTTASGREVRIHGTGVIPTARKKKRPVVRAVTAGLLAAVFGGMLALAGVGVWLLSEARQEAAVQPVLEMFIYDPDRNPYELALANVLGLPLDEQVVVVIDATAASEPWLSEMNRALRHGLLNTNSLSAVVLVYASEDRLHVHPNRPRALAHWQPGELTAFHSRIAAAGDGGLDEAFARLAEWSPQQVILITGREPSEAELAAIREAMAETQATLLDVIAMERDSARLDDLTADYNGQYALLTRERLEQWREAAETETLSGNASTGDQ